MKNDIFNLVSGPFFLLRKEDAQSVLFCRGDVSTYQNIREIPIRDGSEYKDVFDSVSLIPFSQARRERGFDAHDDNEQIKSMQITNSEYISLSDLIDQLPNKEIQLVDISYDTTEEEYEDIVDKVIKNEIGNGEGSNFVITRRFSGKLTGAVPLESVLSIYRSLLTNEFGAYWTFLLYDGSSYVLGASPERHVSKRDQEVKMNPISGTFRKRDGEKLASFESRFFEFLNDKKEIFELLMVTDEELKIMSRICDKGGMIVGPFLKEMSQLIHSEYLLVGQSDRSIHEILIDSMFAPTVTGSPVQNAFQIIKNYEKESRSYYGATIALIGRDKNGVETLDAPITIRTVEVDAVGELTGRVGATLVRSSVPKEELQETVSKISGVFRSIQSTGNTKSTSKRLIYQLNQEDVLTKLQKRNLYLSKFWMEPQHPEFTEVDFLKGKKIIIVDFEDNFSSMINTMIRKMGGDSVVLHYSQFDPEDSSSDLVLFGPGPGNPNSKTDIKILKLRSFIEIFLNQKRLFFAECLSHQVLCNILGYPVRRKADPFQGTQKAINLFGQNQHVGFYNTFSAIDESQITNVTVSVDQYTKEIHAIKGSHFYSIQFHIESILTPNGFEILKDKLCFLFSVPNKIIK